jgi:hypothetical protein
MRNVLFPINRYIETIKDADTDTVVAPYEPEEIAEVARAFKNAQKVFSLRWGTKDSKDETDESKHVLDSRNWTGSNYPSGLVMWLQAGAAVKVILQTTCKGRSIRSWLDGYVSNSVLMSDVEIDERFKSVLSASEQEKLIPLLDFIPPKTTNEDMASAYRSIKKELSASFVESDSWLHHPYSKGGVSQSTTIASIRKFFRSLATLTPNPKSSNHSALIWSSLIRWSCEFTERYDLESKSIAVKLWNTQMDDMHDAITDVSKMTRVFKSWYATDLKFAVQKELRESMRMDFTEIEIKNGYIYLPERFFNTITKLAIEDGLLSNIVYEQFSRQHASWSASLQRMALIRAVGRKEKDWDLSLDGQQLPASYDMFLFKGSTKLTIDKHSAEEEVKHHLKSYPLVIKEWERFVKMFFISDFASMLPRATARSMIHNGIKTYYTFNFDSPYTKNYAGYVTQLSSSDGVDPSSIAKLQEVLTLDVITKPLTSAHDVVEYSLIKTTSHGFFGKDRVPDHIRKVIVQSFKGDRVEKRGQNEYEVVLDSQCFTIKPPLSRERSLDILTPSGVRGVPGIDFRYEEYTVSEKTNWLDLWFTYPVSELDGNSNLEALYEKRLGLFSTQREFGSEVRFHKLPWDEVVTMNYGLVFSLANTDVAGVFESTKAARLLPSVFSSATDLGTSLAKNAKSNKFTCDRYIEINVPVLRSNIKAEVMSAYLSGTHKENDGRDDVELLSKCIFASGDKVQGVSRLAVYDMPFKSRSFKDCCTCRIVVDLARDVEYNRVRVHKYDEKTVTLITEISIPGFESVNPVENDLYYIRGVGTNLSNFFVEPIDFHYPNLNVADAPTLWAELAVSVIRDLALGMDSIFYKKKAAELLNYATDTFVPKVDVQLPVMFGRHQTLYSQVNKMLELIKALETDKKDKGKLVVTDACLDEVFAYLTSIYGDSISKSVAFGSCYRGDYKALLKDVEMGAVRFPEVPPIVRGFKSKPESTCFNITEVLDATVNYYATNVLQRLMEE